MTDAVVLIQYVIQQRSQRPTGLRIWSDGRVQRTADSNPPPGPKDNLEHDRALDWQNESILAMEQVAALRAAIQASGYFELEPRLLINYCKDDPGTMIWTVNLDGRTGRVVVFDPRPRRSAKLDALAQHISVILSRN